MCVFCVFVCCDIRPLFLYSDILETQYMQIPYSTVVVLPTVGLERCSAAHVPCMKSTKTRCADGSDAVFTWIISCYSFNVFLQIKNILKVYNTKYVDYRDVS